MLLTTFFDTHESIKILTKAGFTEEQAEGGIKGTSMILCFSLTVFISCRKIWHTSYSS